MAERDPAGLERQFKEALEHVCETGCLRPSDIRLPIFAAFPTETSPLFVLGYAGDSFDSQRLGVACIIDPPSERRGPNTTGAYNLNPQSVSANKKATSQEGLFAVPMSVRPHKGETTPTIPGQYRKFKLEKPPIDFLVPDPTPAATRSSREPCILMHMRKPKDTTHVDDGGHSSWGAGVDWQTCPCSFCGDVQGDLRCVGALHSLCALTSHLTPASPLRNRKQSASELRQRRFCTVFKDLKRQTSVESYLEVSLRDVDIKGFAAAGVLLFRRTAGGNP